MARAFKQITQGPNESTDDFVDRPLKAMKDILQDSLKHRPLSQNPNILTFKDNSTLQHNTELWEETCAVCRPIVRDLKWDVVFSSLASAIVTGEASAQDLDSTGDLPERHDQNEDAKGNGGIVETEELQMNQRESSSGTRGSI
ncbi:hypothetical protein CJF32_00011377 [Rutstroemia sp. NJR-2017a WRK4]|nr:hypothetical protein CJF32_00011377 [Rutstroemia sp. NJR-2017a WRK4]